MHFSLNPQLLVQSNLGHFSNFSSNRSFCSISGLSCPTCILGTGASSSESVLFLSGFNIQHGSCSCCLFFFFQWVCYCSEASVFNFQDCLPVFHWVSCSAPESWESLSFPPYRGWAPSGPGCKVPGAGEGRCIAIDHLVESCRSLCLSLYVFTSSIFDPQY